MRRAIARAVAADDPDSWLRLAEPNTTSGASEYGDGANPGANYQGAVTMNQSGLVADGNPAVSLDGASGWINPQGTSAELFKDWTDGFTLEAWAKPTSSTANGRIIDIGLPGKADTGKDSIVLQRVGTTTNLAFNVNVAGVWQPSITATNALPLNQISHIAVTVSKTGAVSLYRNGAVVGSGTIAMPTLTYRHRTTYIGRAHVAGYWAGTLDEVAIYKHPLPAGRLATHYAAGTGGAVGNVTSATVAAGDHRLTLEYQAGYGTASLAIVGSNLVGGLRPSYGLPTSSVDADGKQTNTEYANPQLGQATATVVDPAGLALRTTFAYEPAVVGEHYGRQISRTLPGNNAWSYAYYIATDAAPTNTCATTGAVQAGLARRRTGPAPSGGGSERVEESVYDIAGRTAGTREGIGSSISSAPWTCVTYDARDRPVTTDVPARGTEPARTVTSNYAVGGNPLTNSVSDPAGTVTSTVDLLGRVISSTDVWGNTTTTAYDQAGRVTDTAGPGGVTHLVVNDVGQPTEQRLDGTTIATPTYNAATGLLEAVDYPTAPAAGNGSRLEVGRDLLGRTKAYKWIDAGGLLNLAIDDVDFSLAGRVKNQTVDLVDANPVGDNFVYDGAARLTSAWSFAHAYTYTYAPTNTCGFATAGKNTNRTASTDNLTTATYCYDAADRLSSTTVPGITAVQYDDRGNTTTLGGQTLTYDGDDRHVQTVAGATTVRYTRDALDRIVARTENGVTTRYGFAGGGDSPSFTLNTNNQVIERQVGVIGGASVTKRAGRRRLELPEHPRRHCRDRRCRWSEDRQLLLRPIWAGDR